MTEDRAEENRLEAIRASRRGVRESARAECTYVTLSRHKPKRPEGTNSVVAASRTEERSSFYHVSREGEEGKRARRRAAEKTNGAAKVGEAGGGRAQRRVKSSLHKTIRDKLRSPRSPLLPSRASRPLRRSDFRPIKSPRWRGRGGEGSPRGLGESRRALSNFTRNSVNFGAPALCDSRDQPSFTVARADSLVVFFFSPRFLPLRVVVAAVVVSVVSHGEDRVPRSPDDPRSRVARGSSRR